MISQIVYTEVLKMWWAQIKNANVLFDTIMENYIIQSAWLQWHLL